MNEEERIKEFEERELSQLISDLRDINTYTSFKNGAYIYDLGRYQGLLLVNEIERLNNIINELEEYIKPYLYMLNGIQDRDIYEQCQLDDFTDIMEKLQELKENNNE